MIRDILDGGVGGAAEGVRVDPGSDTTNRSDLTEASTNMTVSQPFVSPTNTQVPAMSLCLNDRRNRVFLPSNLDLALEIDLVAQRQAEGEEFCLGFSHGGVMLVPERTGDETALWSKGKCRAL